MFWVGRTQERSEQSAACAKVAYCCASTPYALAQRIAANDRTSYLHAMRAIPGWSALPAVQEVATPMLVVAGDRDYTPLAYKQAYVAQLRNAQLAVVEDSGHATPLDQPERLNRLLQQFIAAHAPRPTPAA